MTKPYFIQLHPLRPFFFGSEANLSGTGNTNYLVHSRLFPQQTHILGMLRYKLLEINDLLNNAHTGNKIEHQAAAEKIIGTHSFRAKHPENTNDFGHISSISLVCVGHEGAYWHVAPFDTDLAFREEDTGKTLFDIRKKEVTGKPILMQGYNPKASYSTKFANTQGKILEQDKIFYEKGQVGITKDYTGGSNNEAFFRQFSYQFTDKSGHFACIAYLDLGEKEENLMQGTHFCTLGAEKTPFKFTITNATEKHHQYFQPLMLGNSAATRIVLLSDTFVDSGIYKDCLFSYTKTTAFRHLQSSVANTQNYYKRDTKPEKDRTDNLIYKSEKFHLLEKGSVLYLNPKNEAKIIALLEKPLAFRQIGYNAFVVINQQQHFHHYKSLQK